MVVQRLGLGRGADELEVVTAQWRATLIREGLHVEVVLLSVAAVYVGDVYGHWAVEKDRKYRDAACVL